MISKEIDLDAAERYVSRSSDIDFDALEQMQREPFRYAQERTPNLIDTGIIIGAEIMGPVLGSLAGPKGTIAGSAIGNYLSQKYRIAKGFQREVGLGELGAATALGAVPFGKAGSLNKLGSVGTTAVRAGQGAGLATAELTARTVIDEGRAPTQEEVASTILFGGVFGGTLGAAEAKYINKTLDLDATEGATRPEVVKLLENKIEAEGGLSNFGVGRPAVQNFTFRDPYGNFTFRDPDTTELTAVTGVKPVTSLGPRRLRVWNPEELTGPEATESTAELLLGGLEDQILLEAEGVVSKAARLKGEKATEQMAAIQQIFEGKDLVDNQIFKGINTATNKKIQKIGDTDELNSLKDSLAKLDHKLGKNKGASNQRARINASIRRLHKRNGLNIFDLQDDMRASQLAPNTPPKLTGVDRPPTKADAPSKYDILAEKYLGQNYEKFYSGLFTTGAAGASIAPMFTDDEESEIKKAGFDPLLIGVLLAAGMGPGAFRKFSKTPLYKKVQSQFKTNPVKTAPDVVKAEKVKDATNPFLPPSKGKLAMKYAQQWVSDTFVPLSRKLKNIDPKLTAIFRNHEGVINVKTREYLDRASPFIASMTKRLANNEQKQRQFKLHLLNGDMDKIRGMMDDLKIPNSIGKEFEDMQNAFEEIRSYARQEGGIDVGYQQGYFPRLIRDYDSFKSALQGDDANTVTKALEEYAQKEGISVDAIPQGVAAEITSRTLRGFPVQPGASLPGNLKQRKIGRITNEQMMDGYADPADALKNYIERTVQAVERRKFLYRNPNAKGDKVGFDGSKDRVGADLGIDMEVDDSLAGEVAKRLLKDNKDLSSEDVQKLKEIIQARFSGKTVDPFIQGVKNLNYIQVMGNFGSAITQLGDLAYSMHFNGFGNTFKSLLNQSENYDFVKYFNLKDHNIDAVTSSDALSKTLDKVFTVTGLKKLDQLAKNTTMNASWKKYKAQAMKDSQGLQDELTEIFGKGRAGLMVKELRESNPGSKNLPKGVEELIWYKFLDLNPATLGEMPKYYNQSGNARILYMLKSFTIKQFDVFRETAQKDIDKANALRAKGDNKGAAKAAADAMSKIVGLGLVFGAANASTDMIKDTMYGRPIKRDELLEDNIWRLLGINRYIVQKARREGPMKAAAEMILPPTAIFDRAWQDISAIAGDKEYKGAMLQGTPLDMVYWKYLGGLDKIERAK
jgi:hypothetical protein